MAEALVCAQPLPASKLPARSTAQYPIHECEDRTDISIIKHKHVFCKLTGPFVSRYVSVLSISISSLSSKSCSGRHG